MWGNVILVKVGIQGEDFIYPLDSFMGAAELKDFAEQRHVGRSTVEDRGCLLIA